MIAWLALSVVAAIAAGYWSTNPRKRRLRGRRVLSAREAGRRGRSALGQEGGSGIEWGGHPLPAGSETNHFFVVGTTGSGKTLTISSIMKKALLEVGVIPDRRALVYDAKRDVVSFLSGLRLTCPIQILNPFDERSSAWEMGKDVTAPATALQVAMALIPTESGSNRFFSDAARDLVTGIQISFIRSCSDAWTFRDVVLAATNRDRLRLVLERSQEGQDLLEGYFVEERTLNNIVSTLRARLAPLEPVAALWQRSKYRISLREWTEGESILVLGNDESVRGAIDSINRVIFKRLTELVLARSESDERRTWFFLDEVREAGKLDGLSSLLLRGRSKGACVVLGFQDLEGMRQVYGNHGANEILGMCSHKAILRLESPETAEWAARLLGEYEEVELLRGLNTTGPLGRRNRTQSEHRVRAHAVMPSELLTLPPASPRSGLFGYYLTPSIGAFRVNHRAEDVETWKVPKEHRSTMDLVPRFDSDQYLERWNRTDLGRLGLSVEIELCGGEHGERPERRKRIRLAKRSWR